jgi:glycosyltransferase involved in cell wall biosynthesis
MRVLHVGKFFPPHPGGIERCLADMCGALTARGVAVAALAHAEPGAKSIQRRDPAGFDVTLAACHGQLLYAPLSPSFPFLLKRTLADFRPDLLHLHLPNTSAFFTLLSPAARRLPWVVHWHADIPLDTRRRLLRLAYGAYRPWERAMLRRAKAIIATSQPYLDSSAALAPWLKKTHVIPLGIADSPIASDRAAATAGDSPLISPRPSALRPPLRILAVGRLSYFKGIDVLLRAIADVAETSLVVIGDGECRKALERQARSLGIEARVQFVGRLDMDPAGDMTLRAAYENADVFCLPSTDRAESFGLVLLEAMRARLPAIASAIAGSGVGFVVREGETGLLVPPGDAAALANALRRLAADAGLRARMGAAGAQRWQQEFTLDRAADRVLRLYEQVLAATPVHA